MVCDNYSKIISKDLLNVLHNAIRNLGILYSATDSCDEAERNSLTIEYYSEGEQLKKAVNQFIDLQLKAYENFSEGKEYMRNYNALGCDANCSHQFY